MQQYLAILVRQAPHDITRLVEVPSPNVDTSLWVYVHLRRIVQDFNVPWLTKLQEVCTSTENCRAMRIGDDVLMCREHDDGRPCTAQEYIFHTLDAAADTLGSIGTSHLTNTTIPRQSTRLFPGVCKQIARVFSHLHHHHGDMFTSCEAETSLYARFKCLVETNSLLPEDALPI